MTATEPLDVGELVTDCLGLQFGKHDNEPVEVGMEAVVRHILAATDNALAAARAEVERQVAGREIEQAGLRRAVGVIADLQADLDAAREDAAAEVLAETSDDLSEWLDSVLSTLAVEAKSVTTPEQAFHLAIRAVHAVRRINFAVDTGYYGAFKSRMAIEKMSGVHLGDYPERAIIAVIDTPAQADGDGDGA